MNFFDKTDNTLPQSILTKLFDCTGSPSGGNKGFFLFYINEVGHPTLSTKTDNTCVDMALSKLVEISQQQEVSE
jgi:hypothetical protein|tara:strand:+ start:2016 stop:2237 length:222 start_codon:yes stop_codon:yes gene_type:complete